MWKRIWDKITTLWHGLKGGISNLIIWFPTVWRDRQWDHQYIYMMLRQKLIFQEKFIRAHGIHVNNKQDADQIQECIDCLDRLIEDDYHSEAFEQHDKRWGESEMNWKDVEEGKYKEKGMVQLNITYPNVKTARDLEIEREDFKKSCQTEDDLRQTDLKDLFNNMRCNIQGWWD